MEKNETTKKRLREETDSVEGNKPTAKKQKTEAMPSAGMDNLPNEIKEKIIKSMDVETLLMIICLLMVPNIYNLKLDHKWLSFL